MNSDEQDPLSTGFEAEFSNEVKNETDVDRDDSEGDFEDAEAIVDAEMKLREFTFFGEQEDNEFASKMHSIENVREFLEKEIGEDTVVQIYPMLLDIGDEIF